MKAKNIDGEKRKVNEKRGRKETRANEMDK